jgi:stage V sporulation protein R
MEINIEELMEWDKKIRELVVRYGLQTYIQEFEICDHNEMIGYMAFSGMPSRYSHWSFGKAFERSKTLYDYGVSGLPYEMVINSDPCVAYLMRDNTLLLQNRCQVFPGDGQESRESSELLY